MRPDEIAARLPAPPALERLSITIAALDAVLSPEWQYRYFSFNPRWSPGQRMASMRDGSGNNYFLVFADAGTVLRAFVHDSELSPWLRADGSVVPEVLQGFPDSLQFVIDEPAFLSEDGPVTDLTFCTWFLPDGDRWLVGPIDTDGGAAELLEVVLDGTALGYHDFAIDYFEVEPGLDNVEAFYRFQPADAERVSRMNPEADPLDVLVELDSVGYPTLGQP